MKNEEVRAKNESEVVIEKTAPSNGKPKPEFGADSQLHNYNVALTRLGDLFGDDDEQHPPKK